MTLQIIDVAYGATHPIEVVKAVGRQILTDVNLSGPPRGVEIEDFTMMPACRAARLIAKAKVDDKKKLVKSK